MTIITTQKIIKIGSSQGVTIPAKDLRALGIKQGDEVEIIARKKTVQANDVDVHKIATQLLKQYSQDFKNLAER